MTESKFALVVISLFYIEAADEELFEDNPEEYIRRDIEGSDVDTRRRAACDLVKALTGQFESEMLGIFGQYVEVRCFFLGIKEIELFPFLTLSTIGGWILFIFPRFISSFRTEKRNAGRLILTYN